MRPWTTAAAVLGLLAAAPSAAAQVVIDPDSPSAKEYAIPLENERRQADPESTPEDGVTQGERSSPLFGAGIETSTPAAAERERRAPRDGDDADGGEGGDGRDAGGGGAGGGAGGGGTQGAPGPDRTPEVVRAAAANPGAPDAGIGTPLTIGSLALAVVVLGGGAGILAAPPGLAALERLEAELARAVALDQAPLDLHPVRPHGIVVQAEVAERVDARPAARLAQRVARSTTPASRGS